MRDLLYVLGTFGFFIVMLAYVSACETLIRHSGKTEHDS
jgi:hypothetical protein